MTPEFNDIMKNVVALYDALMNASPMRKVDLPKLMPKSGVYLFSEFKTHLYVGRSNALRSRYRQHTSASSTHHSASFAFRLAREATNNLSASYQAGDRSRVGLSRDPDFAASFTAAKARIADMDYRFVPVDEQIEQALLEIYCATSLRCPYNHFTTS